MAPRKRQKSTPYEWLEYDSKLSKTSSFYTQYFNNPPWPFRWHYHADHYEILLHLENPGRFLIGETTGDLHEGDLYVLGPGLAHSFYHTFDNQLHARCYTVRFPAVRFAQWPEEFPELVVCAELAQRARCGIRYDDSKCAAARSLIEKLVGNKNRPSLRAFSAFLELLDFLVVNAGTPVSKQAIKYSGQDGKEERLNQICGYLIENISRQVALDEVAELTHMSVANLCVFFRKKTGRTVIQYINELRVSRACELLRSSEESILDIAQESGYSNLSHFNRQFLRVKGVSPRSYRKEQLMNASEI